MNDKLSHRKHDVHLEGIGQDDGNDAGCVGGEAGNPVAWLGKCADRYNTLDFMRYHWKITGSHIYFYEFRVNNPGEFCMTDTHGVIYDGGGCAGQ